MTKRQKVKRIDEIELKKKQDIRDDISKRAEVARKEREKVICGILLDNLEKGDEPSIRNMLQCWYNYDCTSKSRANINKFIPDSIYANITVKMCPAVTDQYKAWNDEFDKFNDEWAERAAKVEAYATHLRDKVILGDDAEDITAALAAFEAAVI